MDRRSFIKNTGLIGGGLMISGSTSINEFPGQSPIGLNEAMRWAQLAFVENDPGHYDPDFWLAYFKQIHAQGVLLSAGGVVALSIST